MSITSLRHDASAIADPRELLRQGFIKDHFCSKVHEVCLSYLSAAPMLERRKLGYKVQIDSPRAQDEVSLELTRELEPQVFQGTVLLLHGFGASKEFMANSALYFRFLGFRVIAPDLLGQGESGGQLSFGIKDAAVLDELMAQQALQDAPIYVLGNSLGSVAATYLTTRRKTDGLILLAPMPRFDRAAVSYIKNYSPLLAWWLTGNSIRDGAIQALAQAQVELQQTDIKPLIASLQTPVLILASPEDPVAPYADFSDLQSDGRCVEGRRQESRRHVRDRTERE